MHKFRGSSCFSHTSQSDNIFHSYYHLSKLWSICCHQLPKGGETCIDHRLQERALLFILSCFGGCTLFVFWLLEILCHYLWDIDDHVVDHKLHLCLLDDIILLILIWSFTLLGDECMYLILIILSAPPRCMWHGRVAHDPNSLCICSPKQILRYAQI